MAYVPDEVVGRPVRWGDLVGWDDASGRDHSMDTYDAPDEDEPEAYDTVADHPVSDRSRKIGRPVRWSDLVRKTGEKDMESRAAKRARLAKVINEATRELAALDARPEEPGSAFTGDEPVVIFDFKYHALSDTTYTFAAVRANGTWYLTGNGAPSRGVTWDALLDWIEDNGVLMGSIRHAIEFRDLSGS